MNAIATEAFRALVSDAKAGSNRLDVIDVRTPAEYRALHVPEARSMPLDGLDAEAVRSSRPDGAQGPTFILCKSSARAKQAAQKLAGAEGLDVVVVEGGTDACVAAGLDVERGKSVMSIERQVRIAAGSLVAIGTALGVAVNPWFLVIPAFVGCGLAFAGFTDTCGMGLMLARMPWNR